MKQRENSAAGMVVGMATGALCGVLLTWITLGGKHNAERYADSLQ